MSSILKVDTIQDQAGNNIISEAANVITIGASGDTITVPAGATVSGFTSAGIDDNADATAITIDSSENVGIKNATMASFSNLPATDLVVGAGSTASGITIYSGTSSGSNIAFADGASGDARNQGIIQYHHNGDYMRFFTSASERMRLNSTGLGIGTTSPTATLSVDGSAIFNESSADVDFRVESNGNANMLFVDGGNDRIGIANSAPLTKLDIQASANNEDLIRLSHPTSAAAAGALLGFNSDGTTDNNVITLGIHYSSDFYDVLNIQRSTRNVGIGTVNPLEQLDISSNLPRIRFTDLSVANLRHVIGSEANDLEIRCDDGNVQATSHIGFKIDGSEKVRMTDTGRVGIGTSNPSENLHIADTASNQPKIRIETSDGGSKRLDLYVDSSSVGTIAADQSTQQLAFRTTGSERMRIDAAGKVGIGIAPSDHTVSIKANDGIANVLELATSDSQTKLNFSRQGNPTAYIRMVEDGSVGTGGLRFGVGLSHNPADALNIKSDGKVGIGTTSPSEKLSVAGVVTMTGLQSTYTQQSFISSNNSNSYTLQVRATSANPASQYITDVSFTAASPDNSAAKFFQMRDSTTARVNINSDGDIYNHDGTYGTISDERIKQNIVDASSQWDDIKNIRVRKYKKKHDVIQYGEENAPNEIGVISQELETVSPGLIKEDKADSSHAELHEDFVGDNPQNVKYVKYSILYMKSIKALQEAMERIETLEAEVTALKNQP